MHETAKHLLYGRKGTAALSTSPVTGNSDLIRRLNRSIVLDLVRQRGPLSRADVKRITGLNFTTVTNAVSDLAAAGLIKVVGLGTSKGGRRPLLLSLNPSGRYTLGCELQSTELAMGLYDLAGNLVSQVAKSKQPDAPPGEVVAQIATCINQVLDQASVSKDQVEGLGIAAPGPLNTRTGVMHLPPNMPGWCNVPLQRMLEEAVGLPVAVEKDGNVAALGEVWFGPGQGMRNLIFIIVDDGIGAGIITDGRLYRGSNDGAGEIGHTMIDLDGPQCSCGSFGCLEAIASGFALARKARHAIRRGVKTSLAGATDDEGAIGVRQLLNAAGEGDKLAEDLLDECGRAVGIAVANVINMYNPELIVLGGRLAQYSPAVLARAQELGKARSFSVLSQDVKIIRSSLGDQFLMAGAAALILARIFRGPMDHCSINAVNAYDQNPSVAPK